MDSRPIAEPVVAAQPRTWDGRLARRLVAPLVNTPVTPNHLTTLRLIIGLVGAVYLARGGFASMNIGALLIVLSNFVDHTDGELARISGKTSRFGHFYDLACDALITVLLFTCMGIGIATSEATMIVSPIVLGLVSGVAVAVIFFFRMRIEEMAGKTVTTQSFAAGFETEDVLYLLPLVTLFGVVAPFLIAAALGASLFAIWVLVDYARVVRRTRPAAAALSRS
jgi:archaetidylinositol phosphate synthase